MIDSIGFTQFEAGRLRSLIDLSKTTAGTARRCKTPEDIEGRYAEVSETLFSTGIISFGLTQSGDNANHAIQIGFHKGNEDTLSEPCRSSFRRSSRPRPPAVAGCSGCWWSSGVCSACWCCSTSSAASWKSS